MEGLSDEEAHTLAADWMKQIKSNVGLTITTTFPETPAPAERSFADPNSHLAEQVRTSTDVIYRTENGYNRNGKSKSQDSVTCSEHSTRKPAATYDNNGSIEFYEKQPLQSTGLCKYQNSWLSTNSQQKDNSISKGPEIVGYPINGTAGVSESQSPDLLDSFTMPLQECANLTAGDSSSVAGNQTELFEIWGFDDKQCKTAMKYLGKAGQNDSIDYFSDNVYEKENISNQMNGSRNVDKLNDPPEAISIQRKCSKGKLFNDVTNIQHPAPNLNEISVLNGNIISNDCNDAVLDSGYYKMCPICGENNSAIANWCEECGKALVSVEVEKYSVDTPGITEKKSNVPVGCSANSSRSEEEGKPKSSFKLNPNSAEFVSAYAKPREEPILKESSNFNQLSPLNYSPVQNNWQNGNSRPKFMSNTGSFPGHQSASFERQQVSPSSPWSPMNLSPESKPSAFRNSFDINSVPQNCFDGRGRSLPVNSFDGSNVSHEQNHFPRGNRDFMKMQKVSKVLPSVTSFSYDSSMDNTAQNVYYRPRSTSLLDFQLNHVSPNATGLSYQMFESQNSALHSMQHSCPVTQHQLNERHNEYQGFDFENPEFDFHLSDCQTFDEVTFSKEFVQTRLCHQVESAYGSSQASPYNQFPDMQSSMYVPHGNKERQNMNFWKEDPSVRMYRKKKLYNSSMDSPRSPKNIVKKSHKGKAKFRDTSMKKPSHNKIKEMQSHKYLENDKPILVEESKKKEMMKSPVPPLALEDLESYDQVLTLIRTAREEAVPYLCLPEEVVLYILSFLSNSDLCRCARVCKQFHRISTDESLWKEIVLRKRKDLSDQIFRKISQKRPISLTVSQCHSNNVTEEGLRDLFRSCGDTLQDLSFSACSGKALVGERILLHISTRCKGLRSLDISWSNVSDIGIQAFAEAVDRLECISMNGCQAITDESVRCIATRHSQSIRVMEMFGCFNISYVSLAILQRHCPNIETVNMGQCHKVTNASVLEFSKQMPKLENIDLRGCKQIKDSAIKELTSNCRLLSTLVIANCPFVTDTSLLAIASHLPTIRCLDVCGCTKISDGGVLALAKSCSKLEILDLSSTQATDKGVISLANYCHQTLESLKLSFCHSVTENSLEHLAKKCKRLKLLHLYGCKSVKNVNKVQDLNRSLVIES